MSAPMSAEINKTERRYQNIPPEKLVSSARWGLESNGLEITDLLNPDPKTTKLVGMKPKWGTVEVLIMDQKPDIIVRVKPIISKKDAETAFLVVFWEKFAAEVGLQKKDVQAEMDTLRKGDFRTFRIADKSAMDLLAEQGRWGLESMGLKILESLRPDAFTAAITGTGKLGKIKTDVHVYIKGGNNLAVVQLQTDKDVTGETRRFWEQLKLNFGESLEEENLKTVAVTQRSAEDQAALDTLTGIWNQITQKDKDLGSMVTNIDADPARTETAVGPLVPHAKDFLPWPTVPVLQRVLQPGRGRNASYLVDLSFIQVAEVAAHPALFTFARLGPNPITKDLQITDKLTFSYQGMDFTDELGRSLREIEEPVLVKPLKSAYSDATLTHYKAEIQGKEKGGSKYSKFLDYLLAEPIRIFNILVGDSEQMVVIARAFLSPDGKITPLPSAFLRLMDQLVTNLDRYCTKPRPTNIAADEAQPTINVALNRCPFCNWLLTPGKTVCPMCRKELPTREAEFIPPPPPPKPTEAELGQPTIVAPPPLASTDQPPAPSGTEGIDQRIQEITYQITALQSVLNDLQAAFTNGSIKFEQYQVGNDQYIQQIGKLQEEKRALERKKFESFKL